MATPETLRRILSRRIPREAGERLDLVRERYRDLIAYLDAAEGKPRRETWVSSYTVRQILNGEQP